MSWKYGSSILSSYNIGLHFSIRELLLFNTSIIKSTSYLSRWDHREIGSGSANEVFFTAPVSKIIIFKHRALVWRWHVRSACLSDTDVANWLWELARFSLSLDFIVCTEDFSSLVRKCPFSVFLSLVPIWFRYPSLKSQISCMINNSWFLYKNGFFQESKTQYCKILPKWFAQFSR